MVTRYLLYLPGVLLTVSIIFGVTMVILAIPLMVVWHQVQSREDTQPESPGRMPRAFWLG